MSTHSTSSSDTTSNPSEKQQLVEDYQHTQEQLRSLLEDSSPDDFLALPLPRQRKILETLCVDTSQPVTYMRGMGISMNQAFNPKTIKCTLLRCVRRPSEERIASLANHLYYTQNTFRVDGRSLHKFIHKCQEKVRPLRKLEVEIWASVAKEIQDLESKKLPQAIELIAELGGLDWVTFRILCPQRPPAVQGRSVSTDTTQLITHLQVLTGPSIPKVMKCYRNRVVVELVEFEEIMGRQAPQDMTEAWRKKLAFVTQRVNPLPLKIEGSSVTSSSTNQTRGKSRVKREAEDVLPESMPLRKKRSGTYI